MKNVICMTVVALAFLLVSSAEPVHAQGYIGSSSPTCYGNFGLMGSPYALGRVPTPPYFALHPPVYYSQPVPRSYGYSPFAYPSTTMTPEIVSAPSAKIIDNPHVTPAKSIKKKLDPNLTQTQVEIINPFFVPRQTRVVSREVE